MEKRILRLLGNRVALQPLKRNRSDTGTILYDMSRMDDRKQWRVLNQSERVWKLGLFVNGDHVITQGVIEADHEFDDGIIIVDAKWVVAKVENGERS